MSRFLLLLLLSATAAAQSDDCPHQVVLERPAKVTEGPSLHCGSVDIDLSSIQLEQTEMDCPAFVLVEPPYAATGFRSDSRTATIPIGFVDVTRIDFDCRTNWFLFLPVGRSCRRIESRVVSSHVTYQQFPCGDFGSLGDLGQ